MVVTRQKLVATGAGPYRAPSPGHPAGGDPILGDGEFFEQRVDASLAGLGPHYEFKRTYRSRVNFRGTLGYGWDHNYDIRILGVLTLANDEHIAPYCDNTIDLQDGDLNVIHFTLVPGTTKYRAPGVSYVLDTFTNENGYIFWRMVDGDGTQYLFDTVGYLSQIRDVVGNTLTFGWEYSPSSVTFPDDKLHGRTKRLLTVTDAARTVYYTYDGNDQLECVSLGAACADPLVKLSYSSHGELEHVYRGGASTPTESYTYRSASIPQFWPVPYFPVDCLPNAAIPDYCHSLCDQPDTVNHTPACRNLDFGAPVNDYCKDWTCDKEGQPQSTVCRQLSTPASQPDALCLAQYDMSPDCWHACIARYQCRDVSNLQAGYAFGSYDDLAHNLIDVVDEAGQRVVHNDYGENPWDVSFDRVIDQHLGPDGADLNVVSFAYHDLQLESSPPAVPESPGSTPDPINVVPQGVYAEDQLCPQAAGCALGPDGTCSIKTYESPTPVVAEFPSIERPSPATAVVITDIHGVTRTQYFDVQYNLIREVNVSANETTDYNYDNNGNLAAAAEPSGVRSCYEYDDAGHVRQATTIPAAGFSGPQTPFVNAYYYDPANQVTDAWADVLGELAKTHYGRDGYERVATITRDIKTGQPPETTSYTYDEDPPPAGIRETPASVKHADNTTVDTYLTIDPSLGGPRKITLDTTGSLPEHRYALYDERGRVIEEGESNRFAKQYHYHPANRLDRISHRPDSGTSWVDTFVSSHWNGGSVITDSVTGPKRATTMSTTGTRRYPNVLTLTPASTSNGEATQTSCVSRSADGRFEDMILPEKNWLTPDYDVAGRLVALWKGTPGAPIIFGGAWYAPCVGGAPPSDVGGKQRIKSWTFANGGFLSSVTDGDDASTVITDGFGRVIQVDAAHPDMVSVPSVQIGYDSRGRIIWTAELDRAHALPAVPYQKPTMQTAGLLAMSEYEYDLSGRSTAQRRWVLETGEILSTTWTYDDATRAVTVTDRGIGTTSRFDGRGRLVSRTFSDGSTLGVAHFLGSDVVTRATNQNTTLTRTLQYDTRGHLTGVLDESNTVLFSASYDDDGLQTTARALNEGLTTRVFDSFGRLHREYKDLLNGQLSDHYYGWDLDDRLHSVSDAAGHQWTIGYTGFDARRSVVDPLGRTDQWSYAAGFFAPAGRIDATGRHSCYRYDYAMRPEYIYSSDCPDNTELRGPATPLLERRALSYGATGLLKLITVGSADAGHIAGSSVGYSFDSIGREIEQDVTTPGSITESYAVKHAYADLGRTVTTTLSGTIMGDGGAAFASVGAAAKAAMQSSFISPPPTCGIIKCPEPTPVPFYESLVHKYDGQGRLFGVDFDGARVATWSYGVGAGGPISLAYANGANTSYSYDNRLRQTGMTVSAAGGGPLASLQDRFGADSIVRMRQRTFGTSASMTDAYQVDGDGRVTAESLRILGVQLPGGEVGEYYLSQYLGLGESRYFGVDNNGDWTSVATNAGSVDHAVDPATRLTGVGTQSMSIDAHDNLDGLSGDPLRFTFEDFSGQMVGAANGSQASSYRYDAADRRSWENDSGSQTTVFFWDQGQIIGRSDLSSYKIDVPGDDIDSHVMTYDGATGDRLFYHQSSDQSVVAVSGAAGQFVEGYSYSAFGARKIFDGSGAERTSSVIDSRFGFQGQLFDPLTATYSMRARQYVPAWGRFASPDPLSFTAAPSLYSFTGGRPLSYRDPLGLAINPAVGPCQRDPKACSLSGGDEPVPPPTAGGGGDGPPPQAGDDESPGSRGGGGGGSAGGPPSACGGGAGPTGCLPSDGDPGSAGGGPSADPGGGGPGGAGGLGRGGGRRGGGISRFAPDHVFAGPLVAPTINPQLVQAMQLADEAAEWCNQTDCADRLQQMLEILSGFAQVAAQTGMGTDMKRRNANSPPSAEPLMVKAPGQPTAADGWIEPKRWDGKMVPNPNGKGYGFPDAKGNVWIPTGEGAGTTGHGGPHWDVQSPGGGYTNVYPGGRRR